MTSLLLLARRLVQAGSACSAGLLLVATDGSSAVAQASGRHPDRRFVDQTISPTSTLRLTGPRRSPPLVLGAVATTTIGTEDGPDFTVFGEMTGVAMTSNGTVVIVDRKTQDVRLFDSRGRFLQRLGRAGQGPGEFRAPHNVLVTSRDEIWVADMQRRLTIFAPSREGYRLSRVLPVDIGIRSMCVLGDELVVNGISGSDPFVVRVIDSMAQPVRAFGKVYTSPNVGVNYQFSEGRVACDNESDMIVYASNAALGELRGYRRDGTLAWRTVVEDVQSNIVTDTKEGGLMVEVSPDGSHSLLSLNVVPGIGVIVQYGFRSFAQIVAKEPMGEVLTVFLNPRTGEPSLASVAWPRLATLSRTRALAILEDPAPRAEVRELARAR